MVKVDPLFVRVGRQFLAEFGDELVPRIPVLKKLKGFDDAGVVNWESFHIERRVLTAHKILSMNYIVAAR